MVEKLLQQIFTSTNFVVTKAQTFIQNKAPK